MSEWFKLDMSSVEALQSHIEQVGAGAGQIIDTVLHGSGAEEIKKEILPLIHSSGRTWKGKRGSAKSANPFSQENDQLAVTIKSRGYYHYLYFPDDGSNTIKHAGNQQFMMRGAENAAGKIIDECVEKLVEKLEE